MRQSVVPLHRRRNPICSPHAIWTILLIQPASPISKEHIRQHGPRALFRPRFSPNQQLLVHSPALLSGDGKHDHLIFTELFRDTTHHFPTAVAKIEDLIPSSEGFEGLDAAYDVFLRDSAALETAQATDETHELGKLDETTVAVTRAHADVHDLHAEFALPIAQAESFLPPAAATWAGEGVDADGCAHLLKRMAETWVAADIGAVVSREMGEGGAELVELCMEIVYVGIGELIREGVK